MNYSILDSNPAIVLVVRVDGKIEYANGAASRFFNKSPQRMVKTSFESLFRELKVEEIGISNVLHEHDSLTLEKKCSLATGEEYLLSFTVANADSGSEVRTIFIVDMTLENTLQAKYKSEILQKEKAYEQLLDYKNNIEKFLIGILIVITGLQFLAIQVSVKYCPPLLLTAMRLFLGGAILVLIFYKDFLTRPKLVYVKTLFMPAFFFRVIGNGGISYALMHIPSGLSSVIAGTIPIWMYIINIYRGNERFNVQSTLGLALGMGGLSILGLSGKISWEFSISFVILLISAFTSAYGAAIRPRNLPVYTYAIEILVASLVLFGASAVFEEFDLRIFSRLPSEAILSLIYLVVFVVVISEPTLAWLMTQTSSARATSFVFVRPIVALLVGYMVAGEALTSKAILATVLVLASFSVVFSKKKTSLIQWLENRLKRVATALGSKQP